MKTDFFTEDNMPILNERAFFAIDNPFIWERLEVCVLNAKTPLAKRRLVRTVVVMGQMSGQARL